MEPEQMKISDFIKFDESQPRDESGRWSDGGGGGGSSSTTEEGPSPESGHIGSSGPSVKLTPSAERAFEGKQIETETKLSKLETGQIGEAAVVAYLKDQGYEDARPLNMEQNNFPVDLVQNHDLIEVKTGVVSNQSSGQVWRATIGQPGKNEQAWLKQASAEEKRAWNAQKSQAILDRKQAVLEEWSAAHGVEARGKTMTTIINPDTKTIDIYEFSGFHSRIRWNSAEAKAAYKGSFRYER